MLIPMSIKRTGKLTVLADQSFTENDLVINPNDGFDLGLMMTEADVELFIDKEFGSPQNADEYPSHQAKVIQKNECRIGTIELGTRTVQKFGGITSVCLSIDKQDGVPKLTIQPF